MSPTDGKGPAHRHGPVRVRQVHLEGLGIYRKRLPLTGHRAGLAGRYDIWL